MYGISVSDSARFAKKWPNAGSVVGGTEIHCLTSY